jgi:phage baseplate assembly protein gpV
MVIYGNVDTGIEIPYHEGDEVVLGFPEGNPDLAIVLGCLHTAKATRPDSEGKLLVKARDDEAVEVVAKAGTKIVSNTEIDGTLTVDKATVLKDTLEVQKATDLKATLTVSGPTTMQTATVQGNLAVMGPLTVGGSIAMNGGFTLGGQPGLTITLPVTTPTGTKILTFANGVLMQVT